jgi:hypothetical protein
LRRGINTAATIPAGKHFEKADILSAFFLGGDMEILNLLWNVLSFTFGLVWQVAWFLLRDLISAILWLLVAVWLVLSVRYRSFSAGLFALLRYGGLGLRLLWRWLRGAPAPALAQGPRQRAQAAKLQYRKPVGTMSISEQLNMLLVGAIYLLILA